MTVVPLPGRSITPAHQAQAPFWDCDKDGPVADDGVGNALSLIDRILFRVLTHSLCFVAGMGFIAGIILRSHP